MDGELRTGQQVWVVGTEQGRGERCSSRPLTGTVVAVDTERGQVSVTPTECPDAVILVGRERVRALADTPAVTTSGPFASAEVGRLWFVRWLVGSGRLAP
jgi:hypothetical protein